jgi:DUF4097 and DUF4098 domain-containing protein YvlB
MQTRRFLQLTIVVITTLLIVGSASAGTLDELIDETRVFAPGHRFELENVNGEITVVTWDRDELRILARKRARGGSASDLQASLDRLEVVIEASEGNVRVDTRFPGGVFHGVSLAVDYEVTLPSHADLDLETVNGNIRLDGVRGRLDIDTTNGEIDVENARGRVRASTTNGGISVDLFEVGENEAMRFETTNGDVRLHLPPTLRASLVARTVHGSIQTDFPLTVQGRFHQNRLDGDINGGGAPIEIRTTNGGITISETSL